MKLKESFDFNNVLDNTKETDSTIISDISFELFKENITTYIKSLYEDFNQWNNYKITFINKDSFAIAFYENNKNDIKYIVRFTIINGKKLTITIKDDEKKDTDIMPYNIISIINYIDKNVITLQKPSNVEIQLLKSNSIIDHESSINGFKTLQLYNGFNTMEVYMAYKDEGYKVVFKKYPLMSSKQGLLTDKIYKEDFDYGNIKIDQIDLAVEDKFYICKQFVKNYSKYLLPKTGYILPSFKGYNYTDLITNIEENLKGLADIFKFNDVTTKQILKNQSDDIKIDIDEVKYICKELYKNRYNYPNKYIVRFINWGSIESVICTRLVISAILLGDVFNYISYYESYKIIGVDSDLVKAYFNTVMDDFKKEGPIYKTIIEIYKET